MLRLLLTIGWCVELLRCAGVPASTGEVQSLLRIEHCVGEGYAVATSDELSFLGEVAKSSGVSNQERTNFLSIDSPSSNYSYLFREDCDVVK